MRCSACKRCLQRFFRINPGVERRCLCLYKNLCEAAACLSESSKKNVERKNRGK